MKTAMQADSCQGTPTAFKHQPVQAELGKPEPRGGIVKETQAVAPAKLSRQETVRAERPEAVDW